MEITAIQCPIHKGAQSISSFWNFNSENKQYELYKCDQCDLIFYSSFPEINYENHTDSIEALKDYVHLNSNIDGLLRNLLEFMPEEGYTSIMEVGCGFGFTLDFAKNILGMDAIGYEPSLYGEVGARELGIEIKRSYLTPENIQDKQVDLIYLSEVLEHIDDPIGFLCLLKKGLTDNGVLLLTTPNYRELQKNLDRPAELAILSPGAHTIIFGEEGLLKLLRQAGFTDITIKKYNDSIIAVSSTSTKNWKNIIDKNELILTYYYDVLKRVDEKSYTYVGVLYRLYRILIDMGRYEEADKLQQNYSLPELPPIEVIERIKNSDGLHELGPSCLSILAYYNGIMNLNYYSRHDLATDNFQKSYMLCKKKVEIVPFASVVEYQMIWLAKYHQALALHYTGANDKALKEIQLLLNFKHSETNSHIPLPNSDLLNMSQKLSNQLFSRL